MSGDPAAGARTRDRAPFAPGARVRKVMGEPGDRHQLGAVGGVVQAVGPLPPGTIIMGESCGGEYAYLVAFDGDPDALTFIRGKKLERV